MRLTAPGNEIRPPVQQSKTPTSTAQTVSFRLILSSPPSVVEINTIRLPLTDGILNGTLEVDPKNPLIKLLVRWQNPVAKGEHRLAKLTLEAPGKDTFTHTFDSTGDLDDLIELQLPDAP